MNLAAGTVALSPGAQPAVPLVFIHGIKGSVLTDARGTVRWMTAWEGLALSSPDLRLPLQWHGDIQDRDGLVATEPLSSVGWHDVYGTFLTWAKTSGRKFYPFAYDWRRDNLENTDAFIQFLEKVRRENGGTRIQVVGHSMGGLITFVALNRRPELFQSVLLAGVPFGGSISFLEDVHAGTSNGFNSSILSPQVFFTFVSPYALFPADPKDSGLVEPNGPPIVHDWYSPDDWARQKLGIFASNNVSQEQREHLRKALDRVRRFRSEIVYKDAFHYPPIAVLASPSAPTVVSAIRNGPHAVKGWDFAGAPKKSGDNRVEFTRAIPPAGVPHQVFKSSRGHEDLLSDTKQVESILGDWLRR